MASHDSSTNGLINFIKASLYPLFFNSAHVLYPCCLRRRCLLYVRYVFSRCNAFGTPWYSLPPYSSYCMLRTASNARLYLVGADACRRTTEPACEGVQHIRTSN